MSKESVFISAVVYVRNNADAAISLIKSLTNIFDNKFSNYEIIVADDCSDVSIIGMIKESLTDVGGSLSVVRMSYPQGVQAAMNAGVDIAIGDFIYEFESPEVDYDPSLVLDVFNRVQQGYDIVSAAPDKGVKFSSKFFYGIFNKSSKSKYPLLSERFRLVSRRAVNRIGAMSDSLVYRKVFYRNCGLECDTVSYRPLMISQPGSLPQERSSLATDSLILFTSVAYKLSLLMTVVMMLLAAFGGIYTLVVFLSGKPIEGWTTMMLFMSAAFFGVFAILTIVVKYLSVLISLSFKKSQYIIEGVNKIN